MEGRYTANLSPRRPPIPHLLLPTLIKPRALHKLRKRRITRVGRKTILPHTHRLRWFQEIRGGHEHIDRLCASTTRRLHGAIRPRAAGRVYALGFLARRGVRVDCVVACADGGGRGRRARGEAGGEAEVELWSAVPHRFYAGSEAGGGWRRRGTHALDDAVGGVGAGLGGLRAPPHEVCSGGVRGVVDGVADLTRDVPKVAGVALFGLGFPPLSDYPDES